MTDYSVSVVADEDGGGDLAEEEEAARLKEFGSWLEQNADDELPEEKYEEWRAASKYFRDARNVTNY